MKINDINLVHLNNGIIDNLPGLLSSRIANLPCISHIRGTEPMLKIEQVFGKSLTKIVTTNRTTYNLYASAFGFDKTSIIYNGVDLGRYDNLNSNKIRHEYNIPNSHFLIGTVGRIVKRKGISEFIKAAARVIEHIDAVTFFVIGDDPYNKNAYKIEMQSLASDLGVNGHVIFTGWRDDVSELMSGLDLVVLFSTLPEGFGMVAVESMAVGVPLITSDVPGFIDIVDDGETGIVVPASSVTMLVKAIFDVMQNVQFAQSLAKNARRKVETHFDIRLTARKIQRLYSEILQN